MAALAIGAFAFTTLAAIPADSEAATATEIARLPWDQSSVATLRESNADEIFAFIQGMKDTTDYDVILTEFGDSDEISGFAWVDLSGDGRYDLVVVSKQTHNLATNVAVIYRKLLSGKSTAEVIEGTGISLEGGVWEDSPKLIEDLNNDGKYELVVPQALFLDRSDSATLYPTVYRLRDGRYVEASRDFPKFYDTQVLPKLDREISEANSRPARTVTPPDIDEAATENGSDEPTENLTLLRMKRDKILRMLGRDPGAGQK